MDRHDNKYILKNKNDLWSRERYLYGQSEEGLETLLTTAKTILKDNKNAMYLVEKNGIVYAICDNGQVVGFKIETIGTDKSMKIAYLYDGSVEYIFNSKIANTVDFYDLKDYHLIVENKYESSLNSAHSFYVYVEYKAVTSEGTKTVYYSYGF